MERNLKVVVDGLGMVGRQCVEGLLKRGVQVVGAVDAYDKIVGMDLGSYLNIPKLNVLIENDLDIVIKRTNPDLVIICTKTSLSDIEEDIRICIFNEVDVLTSSEHAYFWPLVDEKLGKEIDELARKSNVTVCAGGVQDVFWNSIPVSLTSSCHRIDCIEGETLAIVDEFGPSVMKEAFIGCSLEEFKEKTSNVKDQPFSAFSISLYALANKLNLHVLEKHFSFEAILADKKFYCKAFDCNIPVGHLIGSIAKTEFVTEENIRLSCAFISKLKEDEDTAYSKWSLKGEPNMTSIVEDMHGEVTTTSSMINRIPDIINAKSGFITVNDLPTPYYRVNPLYSYIDKTHDEKKSF